MVTGVFAGCVWGPGSVNGTVHPRPRLHQESHPVYAAWGQRKGPWQRNTSQGVKHGVFLYECTGQWALCWLLACSSPWAAFFFFFFFFFFSPWGLFFVDQIDMPLIIIMYIYHALINALSAHMIHINLNMIFCTHAEHGPTKNNLHKVL